MSKQDYIRNVAIVGAGGNLGTFITNALLKTGRHILTAVSRYDSQSQLADGVAVRRIDYEKPDTIVEALRGQDCLIVTLSGRSPIQEAEAKLVRAASEAGVPWILPNEWSPDSANEGLVKDVPLFGMKVATRKLIERLGQSSYIAVVTGFWYEYSLAIPTNYGFNFIDRTVTLLDEGETKVSTSTWSQIGCAVAALLSLPIESDTGSGLTGSGLSNFRNQTVYINSFTISQRDMLASALRVTGTQEHQWTITKESSSDRFKRGVEAVKKGDYSGYANMLYTRVFFPDVNGNFEHRKGILNGMLHLQEEDLDEVTKIAIERQRASQ